MSTDAKGRKRYQSRNRAKMRTSQAETIAMKALDANGIPYKHQMILGFFIVDFALMERMLVVEIDGGYHDTPKQRWYDRQRDKYITKCGFEIVHIKNEDAHKIDEIVVHYPIHRDYQKRFNKGTAHANAQMDKAVRAKKKREELEFIGQTKLI